MSDVRAWLAGRSPRPPEGLALPLLEGQGTVTERLAESGAAALERALAGEGERRGAFELLAADALLTYACESAAAPVPEGGAAPDPEAELLRIVERVAGHAG